MTLSQTAMSFIHDRKGPGATSEPHATTGTFGRGWEQGLLRDGESATLMNQTGGARNDGARPRTEQELQAADEMFPKYNPAKLSDPTQERADRGVEAALIEQRKALADFLASRGN